MQRWQLGDVMGALLFGFLLGVRLRQALLGSWFALALAAQAGAAAVLLLARRKAERSVPLRRQAIAWLSTLLPFGLQAAERVETIWLIMSAAGVALSLWGLVALGRSFGIAPADRGLVGDGPYRLVRHPMYLGELVSFAAVVASNPHTVNVLLLAGIVGTVALRVMWEEQVLAGYRAYSEVVRWRMIPGVW